MLRGSNFQKPYPPEFRREAVALYRRGGATLREVARDLGVSSESLRLWVKQAAIDAGETNGLSTEERQELRELRLLAEELPPARAYPPRRRLQTSSEQQPAHGARRHTHAELQQFTRDPRVAPTWLLACEPQHELTHAIVNRRTSRARLRPRHVGTPAARTRPQIRPNRITLVPVAEVPREQFDLGKRHGQRGAMPVSPWDEPASSGTLEERRAYLLGYQNGRVSAASGTSAASTAKRRAARN